MKINFLAVKFVYAVFEGIPKTLSKFESSCEKFLDLPMVQIRELLLVSKNHSTKFCLIIKFTFFLNFPTKLSLESFCPSILQLG